jgi:hypothetical protein
MELLAGLQQCGHTRHKGHKTAAPEALLPGFTVFQQLRVKADAGIDQKNSPIHPSDLNLQNAGAYQRGGRRLGVLRNCMGATKIIERALG